MVDRRRTTQGARAGEGAPIAFYLAVAFVEGSAVMVAELLGAKMIAPFYGTSLFVWSSVLGVTLASLAAGYFFGGFLADRFTGEKLLFTVLAIGAFFIAVMPFTSQVAMEATLGMGVRAGSLVSALVFLFTPLVCMGMVSPILIRLASRDIQHAGRTAGTVYAVSTVGGILATFLTGFYIIPTFGIVIPAVATAGLLGLFPAVYFVAQRRWVAAAGFIAIMAVPLIGLAWRTVDPRIIYRSEGLLGQVLVVDVDDEPDEDGWQQRVLYVNRFPQTNVDLHTGNSLWKYVHMMGTFAASKPPGSTALVLGLGGGSVAREFVQLGFEVDGVELDERITDLAGRYFKLPPATRIVVDDARHFVRTVDRRYDVIVYDVFAGEQHPSHILTRESFAELKRILAGDGLVLINFTGFLDGPAGRGARSVLRTLVESGFDCHVAFTPGGEANRNMVIAASPSPLDFSGVTRVRQNECCRTFGNISVPPASVAVNRHSLADAEVLTDAKPVMELLNLDAAEAWRRFVLEHYREQFTGNLFF